MEKLSVRKRNAIVGDYLSAMSYSEIAARQHVSTGTVANVVADLKVGRFPEAGEVGEQIEQLKDLSLDLKRANLTPGKCGVGLMVLARINECGLDPADIDRWPLILKSIGNQEDAQEFLRGVYGIQDVQKRTGLGLDALHDKVHELEKKAAELEPLSGKLADGKKQFAELTGQRGELSREVASLEQKRKLLTPEIKDLEKREDGSSRRIAEIEPRARKAETTLNTLGQEMKKLEDIGLPFEALAEFNRKVKEIARRHNIKPAELRNRLLHELGTLDKGLGLEALIQNKKLELNKAEKDVAATKKEMETTKAVVSSLKQEKENLEASIKESREQVGREIARIIPIARNTVAQLTQELKTGVANALAEVGQLRDKSLEAGKEVGRCQEIIETNTWLKELMALKEGEQSLEAKRVRAIALPVLRGIHSWLKVQDGYSMVIMALTTATNILIKELEEWNV